MELEEIKRLIEKNFDAYEIFYLKEIKKKLESKDCEISGVQINVEEGVALRAIKGKKLAFSYTFDLSSESILQMVARMHKMLPYLEEDDFFGFVEKKEPSEYPNLLLYDHEGEKQDIEDKANELIKMERVIRKDGRIVATRHCEMDERIISAQILNSNGVFLESSKTIYTVSALAVAKGDDEVSWYDYTWSHKFGEIKFEQFGEEVREKAISFLSPKELKTGFYTGILSPRVAADLLSILSSSFLAENLDKKKTRLDGRIDKKCFSDLINIFSTGIHGPFSFPFDGEGYPTGNTLVVKEGYFKTFLYDLYYAKKLKAVSTGNCVREGLGEMPKCGILGLYIAEGDGIIEPEEKELVIEDLIGVHTANPVTGEFSLGSFGFIKNKGRLVPFHGVVISGDVFEIFENVCAVGSDLKFYGKYGSPSLRVKNLRISGI